MSWNKTARGNADGVKASLASAYGGGVPAAVQAIIGQAIDAFPEYVPSVDGMARMFEVETNGHIPDGNSDPTGTFNIKITAHQVRVS